MEARIVLTEILKNNDKFLLVSRSENDEFIPWCMKITWRLFIKMWIFKISFMKRVMWRNRFNEYFKSIMTHCYNEVKNKTGNLFII